MIAHVAEAGENRGRVVVRLGDFAPSSEAAIAAAIHVAIAFRSELEGLFIEELNLYAACAHEGLLREVRLAGSAAGPLQPKALVRDAEHFAVAVQRQLSDAARAAGVPFAAHVVRDDVTAALEAACAKRGPWNIIAFAEPIAGRELSDQLSRAVCQIWGTTGYIAAGSRAQWRPGPVVVAVEDMERLTGMIRAAERLASVAGDRLLVVPVAEDDIALDWLEGELRLTLADAAGVTIAPRAIHAGSALVLRAIVAGYAPRLVIARHGGFLLPDVDLSRPLSDLGCPAFLVH